MKTHPLLLTLLLLSLAALCLVARPLIAQARNSPDPNLKLRLWQVEHARLIKLKPTLEVKHTAAVEAEFRAKADYTALEGQAEVDPVKKLAAIRRLNTTTKDVVAASEACLNNDREIDLAAGLVKLLSTADGLDFSTLPLPTSRQ